MVTSLITFTNHKTSLPSHQLQANQLPVIPVHSALRFVNRNLPLHRFDWWRQPPLKYTNQFRSSPQKRLNVIGVSNHPPASALLASEPPFSHPCHTQKHLHVPISAACGIRPSDLSGWCRYQTPRCLPNIVPPTSAPTAHSRGRTSKGRRFMEFLAAKKNTHKGCSI